MDLENELLPLARYINTERLEEIIDRPIEYLPEQLTCVIPTINIASDGPILAGLLLVTDRFLCDVPLLVGGGASEFDFVSKASIKNYRFKIWTHWVKDGDMIKSSYELAQIVLLHELSGSQFQTELSFAGDDNSRTQWLHKVVKFIPVSSVLG